jgi:crotonobetainyl-CoA:carnitine CoA-transferase CaiB-like acyl-CoA transferase
MVVDLLEEVGLPPELADVVTIEGDQKPFATHYPVVECAASVIAALGAVAASLHESRTGERQRVTVARGHAAASLVGFLFQRLEDGEIQLPPSRLGHPMVQLHQCKDGRWVHLHGAFPHLGRITGEVLGCAPDSSREAVAAKVAGWNALGLEEALAAAGTCGVMARTTDEWLAHPQWAALAPLGRVSVEKIGESDPEPAGARQRPLGGTRVLDLTRVLAGPTCGRTLAEHGADVLLINSPTLDNVPMFVMDTSHGKRSAFLDLSGADGVDTLRGLVCEADVFSQGYRGGAMARKGFGPAELAELRPGIVSTTINCYGDVGPWSTRPGWEQMAQTTSGIAVGQGSFEQPKLIEAACSDYTTGYLAALGTMAALWRREREGGSYQVRASLCQTATWFTQAPAAAAGQAGDFGDVGSYTVQSDTPYGRLSHLAPVVAISGSPTRWDLPTAPLGTHDAEWVSRP